FFDLIFCIPSLLVIYLLALCLIPGFGLFTPLFVYITVILCEAFRLSIENSDFRLALALPWLFAIIHVSYGIGFVMGLLGTIVIQPAPRSCFPVSKIAPIEEIG